MAKPERRESAEPRDRIDVIQDSFNHFERKVIRILGCLIAWDVAWVVVLVLLINANSNQSARIQRERYDAAFNNCTEVNNRHDDTVGKLTSQENKAIAAHPKNKAQIKRDTSGALILINALVPHRDCKKVAATVVAGK